MRLYYHPLSANSRRALLTALQLGLNPELVLVDLAKGEHKARAYRRLNPNGTVPLLVHDGLSVWDSHAIIRILADATPGQSLYPRDAGARAEIDQWLVWSATRFAPAANRFIHERVLKPILPGSEAPDPVEIARAEALLPGLALALDQQLAGRHWITLERLTLVDLAIAAPLMHWVEAGMALAPYDHLLGWFARVQSLEAWARSSP